MSGAQAHRLCRRMQMIRVLGACCRRVVSKPFEKRSLICSPTASLFARQPADPSATARALQRKAGQRRRQQQQQHRPHQSVRPIRSAGRQTLAREETNGRARVKCQPRQSRVKRSYAGCSPCLWHRAAPVMRDPLPFLALLEKRQL